MYKELNKTENIEINQIRVNLIKSSLIDLKKDIGNTSKDGVNKTEGIYRIADIVELILNFDEQQRKGLNILTPSPKC